MNSMLFSYRAALLWVPALAAALSPLAHNTSVPEGHIAYAPSPIPDRIVLTLAENPATAMAVSWRTDTTCVQSQAELAFPGASPALHLGAKSVAGAYRALVGGNGKAHHHQVRFQGLTPSTQYAYRVMGRGTWSEWFHFTTAAKAPGPFSFVYFGDAQNAVKSHFSRVIRRAFQDLPRASFLLHAGDLVNLRDGKFDDEWGEWFGAGGWMHGMIPSVPVAGNHEYEESLGPDGKEASSLSPAFAAQFAVPENGPKGLKHSVYHLDYRDMRVLILDSESALEHGTLAAQAQWAEPLLKNNPRRWTVVSFHHPMYSAGQGRDNKELRQQWKPLFDKYGVDLVLQGHDHVYGRRGNLEAGKPHRDGHSGPVYVVSVAGPKMYLLSDSAKMTMTRTGEDLQLYQLIHVDQDRLRFEAHTADGQLYDAFDLVKRPNTANQIVELLPPERDCTRPAGQPAPKKASRCWTEDDLKLRP